MNNRFPFYQIAVPSNSTQQVGSYRFFHGSLTKIFAFLGEQSVPNKYLTKEDRIAHEYFSFEETVWHHTSATGKEFSIYAKEAEISQIIVCQDGKYIRCIRPGFKGLSYKPNGDITWKPLTKAEHVLPNVLVQMNDWIYYWLFISQESYETSQQALKDLSNEEKLVFHPIWEAFLG